MGDIGSGVIAATNRSGAGVRLRSLLLGVSDVPGSSLMGVTDDHLRTNVVTGRIGTGVLTLRILSVWISLTGSISSCASESDVSDPMSGAG